MCLHLMWKPGFEPWRCTPSSKALSLQLLSLFGERLLIRMKHIIVHAGKITLYLYTVEVHIRGGCPRNCSSSLVTPCNPLPIPIFLLIYSTASGGLGHFRKKTGLFTFRWLESLLREQWQAGKFYHSASIIFMSQLVPHQAPIAVVK